MHIISVVIFYYESAWKFYVVLRFSPLRFMYLLSCKVVLLVRFDYQRLPSRLMFGRLLVVARWCVSSFQLAVATLRILFYVCCSDSG